MSEEIMRRERENSGIDLIELMYAMLKRWWLLFIGALVGGAAMLAITLGLITPMYQSNAMLYMVSSSVSISSMADLQLGNALAEDFSKIAGSKTVIDRAIDRLKDEKGKTFTRGEIQSMMSVTNTATRMLAISVTGADAEDACDIANALADEAATRLGEITKTDPPSIVEKAEVAIAPISPNVRNNVLKGILGGFFLVAFIICIQHIMNDNIKTEEDVEKVLGLKTLVVIPIEKKTKNRRKDVNGEEDEA